MCVCQPLTHTHTTVNKHTHINACTHTCVCVGVCATYIHVCIICTYVMCSVCAHQCQSSHTQLYVVILIHRNPKVTFTQNEHYTHYIIHIHRSTVDRKRIFSVLHICQPCDCHMIPSSYGHVIVWQHFLYNIILVM